MTLDRDRIIEVLPRYEIGDEIGRGAWGVVLRARHRQLDRDVAVKELPAAFAADPGVRRRFISEARLLATLDHPHVVPIYDYVEGQGLCLLVMELLSGGTVWGRLTTEGVTSDAACSLVLATCSALHHAHGKGILHRDIKPENLLFTATGTLKVSDFGIAKVVSGAASMGTRTGEVLGTPAYMAPEQALGHELTPATDVYALGTVLYELLSGRLPFSDDGNAIGLLYRHVHEDPLPLSEVRPDLPPTLAPITMRALAREPDDRYPTAEDFGVELADAATAAWGAGWVPRSGLSVLAGGRISERISAPGPPADEKPGVPAPAHRTRSLRAPITVVETAADDRAGAADAALAAAPEDLVPLREIVQAEPAPPEPPTTPAPTTVAPVSAPSAAATPVGAERLRHPRRRMVLIAAAVVMVVAAAGVAATQLGSTGTHSSRATAGSTPAGPGRLVFSDNFSNPSSGWAPDAQQDDNGAGAYIGGGYQVTALKPNNPLNTFSVASPYAPRLTSMAVGATATILSGAPADGAGVRCDQGGRSALRYTFETHGDGTWVIFQLGGPGQPVLSQGGSSAIHRGTVPNTIMGQCTEVAGGSTQLVMTINGAVVGATTYAHGGNPIGWHGALTVYRSQPSPRTQVRFTDFRTFDLGASTTTTRGANSGASRGGRSGNTTTTTKKSGTTTSTAKPKPPPISHPNPVGNAPVT